MLKVGIFTPYVRNEITLAATQFADWLVRCGIEVVMLSSGKIENGIHPVWDRKVRRARKSAVYSWAHGATHLCWFEAGVEVLEWTRLVTSADSKSCTKHFYFPHWSRWTEACSYFADHVDRVICLNRDIYYWLYKLHIMDAFKLKATGTYASLMTPNRVLLPKQGKISADRTSLLTVLTKSTVADMGIDVLGLLDVLLVTRHELAITVLIEASLPRVWRSELVRMRKEYGERFQVVKDLPYYCYSDLARQHDWVYVANTRHLFGSLLSTLNASSVPLICHDLPPVGAYVGDKHSGRLIPCGLQDSAIPVADVDLKVVLQYLDDILGESELQLTALQIMGVDHLRQRQVRFEQFVYKEFV